MAGSPKRQAEGGVAGRAGSCGVVLGRNLGAKQKVESKKQKSKVRSAAPANVEKVSDLGRGRWPRIRGFRLEGCRVRRCNSFGSEFSIGARGVTTDSSRQFPTSGNKVETGCGRLELGPKAKLVTRLALG